MHFRRFFLHLCPVLLLAAVARPATAAGLRLIEIPAAGAAPAIQAVIWSPCAPASGSDAPGIVQAGPFALPATRDCPIDAAAGSRLPLVVISHGHAGTYLGHHDTAEALADAGFVVAALNHPGDTARDRSRAGNMAIFASRPADIHRLIDYMLDGYAEAARIDAGRIGMFGFSRGGYTALVIAGARPDFRRAGLPCPDPQAPLCAQGQQPALDLPGPAPDPRVRAVVIADPLNAFPDKAALTDVRLPLLLWASETGGQGVEPAQVAALARDLPVPPDFRTVPRAGHFAFLTPCPAALAEQQPDLCRDAPGFDRVAFHREFNTALVAFFRQHLAAGR